MNNFQKVFRNTSYLFISEIIIKILGVLWVVILARNLSVDNYGIYSVVVSFIAIFSFLPDMGVGIITIREIAKHKNKASTLLGEAFLLNSILAFLTIFVALFISYIFHVQEHILIFIALITLLFSTIRSIAVFYFDGMEKMQFSAILNSLNSLLLITFAATGLFLFSGNVYFVFIGMLIGTLVSVGVSYMVLYRYESIRFTFDIRRSAFLLKEGIPLGIASFAALIYSRIDVVMLSKFLGNTQAGIYSAATPFSIALVQLLNVPFVVALFPALARLHKEDSVRFKKAIYKSLSIVLLWSVPAAFLIYVFSGSVISLLFGNKYDKAIPILKILVFSVPFISLSAVLYKVLVAMQLQKDYLFISVIGAALNILLNILLIPNFGIQGAAFSAVLTQMILFITYFITVKLRLKSI